MDLKKILAGHLLVLALVFPYTVSAEDFSFNVGVNLVNIKEDVSQVQVVCVVGNAPNVYGENTIGSIFKFVDMPANGVLNTSVELKFNANAGKNPAEATHYRCVLQFKTPTINQSVVLPASNASCTNPDNDWKCAKAGATFVGPHFSGTIP